MPDDASSPESLGKAAARFAGALGRFLAHRLTKLADRFGIRLATDFAEFLQESSDQVRETLTPLAKAVYDTTAVSFLVGSAEAAKPASKPIWLPPQPPELIIDTFWPDETPPRLIFPVIDEAAKTLAAARVLTPQEYYETARQAREESFTVSGGLGLDTIDAIREKLAENVATGPDREGFLEDVQESLSKLPISEAHLEQVFRNNVNQSFSDGKEKTLSSDVVADAFPYRAYVAIHDDRARPTHLAMETWGLDGTNIYHKDDPVWRIFRPPWDWNCRCGFIAYTVRAAAEAGVKEAQAWLETGVEPIHTFVKQPPWLPTRSWLRIKGEAA